MKKLINFNEEQALFIYQITKTVSNSKQNTLNAKLNEQKELNLDEFLSIKNEKETERGKSKIKI